MKKETGIKSIVFQLVVIPLIIGLLLTIAFWVWCEYDAKKHQTIAREIIDPKAAEFIAQNHPGNDFIIEDAVYSFYNSQYTVSVSSPSSTDTHFAIGYHYKTLEYIWDTYYRVTEGYTTRSRLLAEYEHRVMNCLDSLEELDTIDVRFCQYSETTSRAYGSSPAGLDPATLILDQPYDESMGDRYGKLSLTLVVPPESGNIESALSYLLELDALLTESGAGYYVLELYLGSTPRPAILSPEFNIYGVRREDLHCEDPLSRLQQLWDKQEARRQEIKAGYEK